MKAIFIFRHATLKACVCCLALLLSWAKLAVATDNYAYKDGEYTTISGGKSPDGRWSIASHGEGEYGDEDFKLYLLCEPAHEKPVPLDAADKDDHLDTAPLSNVALWAPDSRHVIILYRSDRHVLEARLLRIAAGKAQSIKFPLLVDVIGKKRLKRGVDDEVFSRIYRVTWRGNNRLAFKEFDTFDTHRPIFRAGLEAYLDVDREGPQRTFTTFSASAVGRITKGGKLRLSGIKPKPHLDKTIIYSPHLLYESGMGVHDTETTMSSIEEQKRQRQPAP